MNNKIYTEFFTNVAVAWFAAGIIGPIFSPSRELIRIIGSLIAVFGCLVSLRLAIGYQGRRNG
ncbi:MAG: hypothetical protein AUJ11_00265 [Parcubacteria group bacterium CG1_02_44_65]|nr:MAG: hypothetical protein AUJ11_00265 [Parcubacteria group bacterium CG1_02_44_65]